MTKKIAIIGGGIVGSTAAFYLSKNTDYDITLFDHSVGQATRASAGIISPWLSRRRNKKWYQLVKLGAAFYPEFLKEVLGSAEIPATVYQKVGTLIFKTEREYLEDLLAIGLKRREEAPEIGELKILSPSEIKALVPIYTKSLSALYAAGGARVDGRELVRVLLEAAQENGLAVVHEHAILREGKADKWSIQTETIRQEFDYVVLANSAWLPETLEPLGYEVDIRPQKGQLVELQTDWETNNWPVIVPVGEKDIIPFLNGKILIGATHEDDAGFDLTLEKDVLAEMVKKAKESFSDAFDQNHITAGRVGTRAYTSDYAPFFGEVPGLENVFTASGMGSSGLTAGPILGKMLSDLIQGHQLVLDLADYPIEHYVKKL